MTTETKSQTSSCGSGGSASSGGTCAICGKPTYWVGTPGTAPGNVCMGHNGVSDIGVPPRYFLDKLEYKGAELEAAKARIKELEKRIENAVGLLKEVRQWHSDPSLPEYNHCDTAPCHFCEQAAEIILDGK